jgi:hypothetical protein
MSEYSYILQDFEDDKRGYRQLHRMLSEGGSDFVHKKYRELTDLDTKDYWLMLLDDMVAELTGLFESFMIDGSEIEEEILENIKAY